MNKITFVTRRNIADSMIIQNLWYHGKLNEPDFLGRLFNLKELPSSLYDYRFNNAYDDIYQHTVLNNDYEPDWIFTDSRFDLLNCNDDLFLRFLSETLHPIVRNDSNEITKLLDVYNSNLSADGFEIAQSGQISNRPIFTGRKKLDGQSHLEEKQAVLKKYLTFEYVHGQIDLMKNEILRDTSLAIGTAKEVLESVCKSILNQQQIVFDKEWTLARLVKETSNALDFKPKTASEPNRAEASVKQILGGIGSIVQGIAELRNSYGSGHGKDEDFKPLESRYARLIVGMVSEIALFYLETNGETAELIDTPEQ